MDNRTIEEVRSNETKLIKEIEILEEENQKLKKQLSNDHQIKMKRLQQQNRKLKQQLSNSHQMENQQKEFIEYLENEIKNSDICDVYVRGMKFNSAEKMIYKDILSKYKETIGGSDGEN